jgi:nucleoside-diphosphate-sugar epimerase
MSTVLVTGSTGFVGRHLCHALALRGYGVRGTYRLAPSTDGYAPEMEWVQVRDIGPDTDWQEALRGMNYVVHLAGLAHRLGADDKDLKEAFNHVNARGTARLADAIRGSSVRRLVFISSAKAMVRDALAPGAANLPDSEYGRSKFAAEQAITQALADGDADFCILRPCLVYGPGNLGNMARLMRLINTGLPLPFGSIHNRKSFIYVGNLVAAIATCLTHPAASRRTFALSDGEAISTPELLYRLGRYSSRRVRLLPMPVPLMKAIAKVGDSIRRWTGISIGWDSYSVDRLCNSLTVNAQEFFDQLQWTPPYSMEEGIRITMSSAALPPATVTARAS